MLSLMMSLAMASTPPLILDCTEVAAGEWSSVVDVVSDVCTGDVGGVQDSLQLPVLAGILPHPSEDLGVGGESRVAGEARVATGCSMAAGSPSGPMGAALLWLLLWSVSMRRRGSDPIR